MSSNPPFGWLQVRALEVQGNWAGDWSVVRVSADPSGAPVLERIRGCYFQGPVLLGSLGGQVSRSRRDACHPSCLAEGETLRGRCLRVLCLRSWSGDHAVSQPHVVFSDSFSCSEGFLL